MNNKILPDYIAKQTQKHEVYVVVEKEVVVEPKSIVGIDLGLKRMVTACEQGEENTVLLFEKTEYKEFFI